MEHKALHAYLSTDAHDLWHQFAKSQNVTVSALLEAFAEHWSEMQQLGQDLPDDLKRNARRVDAERRRRSFKGAAQPQSQ